MTREDEIKNIALCYAHDELKDNHGDVEDIVASAFIDGTNYADSHPHWISVEDELPPITQWVLTYNPTYDEYHFDVERYGRGENLVDFGVTHWLPLPQAPKEGGEE